MLAFHPRIVCMWQHGDIKPVNHRNTGEITYGRIPAGSVVVPGALPSADRTHSLYCAVIVKQIDEKTRGKIAINELLREASSYDS